MSSTTTTPPSTPPPKEGPEFDFLTWFELNRKPVVIGIGVVCAAVAAFLVVRAQQRAHRLDAARELLRIVPPTGPGETPPAVDPQQLLAISQQFPGTTAGEQAQLLAAGQLFSSGKYAESQAQFAAFEDRYGNSPFLGLALLGAAASLEAQGKAADALSAYDRVISSSGSEAFAAQARLAKARMLKKTQPAQALTLLDDVLRGAAAQVYGEQAGLERAQLLLQHPELVPAASTTNSVVVRPPAAAPAPAAATPKP